MSSAWGPQRGHIRLLRLQRSARRHPGPGQIRRYPAQAPRLGSHPRETASSCTAHACAPANSVRHDRVYVAVVKMHQAGLPHPQTVCNQVLAALLTRRPCPILAASWCQALATAPCQHHRRRPASEAAAKRTRAPGTETLPPDSHSPARGGRLQPRTSRGRETRCPSFLITTQYATGSARLQMCPGGAVY